MSGGVVFQEALRVLSSTGLHELAEHDTLQALEAARKDAPLDLLYDCGSAARLPRDELLVRSAAIYFSFTAGNLADDLADGECTYLGEPLRTAPCVQFILQNLFVATLGRARLLPSVIEDVGTTLARASGPQLLEVRTRQWTIDLARVVGESIAGMQYAAYMRLLWHGSPLEPRAHEIGCALGIAGHVAKDIATKDPRITTLTSEDAAALVTWAREHAEALRKARLECLDATLRYIDPILAQT